MFRGRKHSKNKHDGYAEREKPHGKRFLIEPQELSTQDGEFSTAAPDGLIADAFFSKGMYKPQDLFNKIADLLRDAPIRPHIAKPDKSPVWIPRNESGYFVLTCGECLRSFSVPEEHAGNEMREASCVFCDAKVCFLGDAVAVKKKSSKLA